MKKFHFPLDRALDWRRGQAQIEEGKLEQLYGEIRGIDSRQDALKAACADCQQNLVTSSTVTGAELEALDTFRRFSVAEHVRLEGLRIGCKQRIAVQLQIVTGKRRDVRLLERLREQRVTQWNVQIDREIDAQADESFLAKWTRGGS